MQTVFITGAGGFAGSHLLTYLRYHGYDVVAGVRNRARKLAYERHDTKAIVCDITDPINVARAIASVRPDGVVHLAGTSSPPLAATEPLEAYQTIDTSWANLLDAVRRTVPRAKVLLVSACEVYGNAGSDGRALPETAQPEPVTTFGSLKATAESIAHTFFRDFHLNVTIVRPFHHTGPGQLPRGFCGSVANRLAMWDRATHGSELALPDLNCRRDLLHVYDVVAAYERLLADGRPNEVYNVCAGDTVPCRDIVSWMLADFRLDLRLSELPADPAGVQIPVLRGDNTKIRSELGWVPTRSPRDAVRDLVARYRVGAAAPALR